MDFENDNNYSYTGIIFFSEKFNKFSHQNGGKNKRPLGMLFLCRISASEKYPKRPDLFLRKWQQSFVSKGIIFFNEIFRFFDLILCRLHFQRLVTIYLIV